MDGKSTKPRRMGNHYIPPPARKHGFETNEGTRHKERPMKTCENKGVKLCNDSSLLFKESTVKVNEKSRRSRRSKRTANKADVENADHRDHQVAEPKSSSTASGLTDRFINYKSDQNIDSPVLVERPKAKIPSIVNLENTKPRYVDLSTAVGSGADHEQKLMNPIHYSDQKVNVIGDQAQPLEIFPSSDPDNTETIKTACEILKDAKHDSSVDVEENYAISDVENKLPSSEPNQSCELIDDDEERDDYTLASEEFASDGSNSHEPAFSIIGEETTNLCSESYDCKQTDSQESIADCDKTNSKNGNKYSNNLAKIKSLRLCDSNVAQKSTTCAASSNNFPLSGFEDGDWDSIYDDRGECLLPPTATVSINNTEVQKNGIQTKTSNNKKGDDDDDQPQETSSIIEIYGFAEELKTNDILNAFGNWNQRGFNLKWVDNTHALGIFPTPALAAEVLHSNIPIVKIRPISQGTALSQEKARTLVLPSSLRPKTCSALARRLVSGALGLRVNVTPEERAAERELLREAREKKKLVLKQRDAAWEGNFASLNCSEDNASN